MEMDANGKNLKKNYSAKGPIAYNQLNSDSNS